MRMTPDQFMATLGLPQTYRVGGSVRDQLLGRTSKDSDYMIRGATLPQIEAALVKAGGTKPSPLRVRTSRQQVGWRIHVKGLGLLEIVLPRKEVSTGGRHGDFDIVCDPSITLAEDATRRDFTINSLYIKVDTQETIDPLGCGNEDLEDGIIETTHADSFRDDPLRTLRALRFLSKLEGFALSANVRGQMEKHATAVTGLTNKGVSGTALTELCGILMGNRPGRALQIGAETGVLQVLLPELEPMIGFDQRSRYHDKSTSDHTWACLEAAANMHNHAPLRVRMALLFHDCGKPKMAWKDEEGLQHYYALSPARAVALGAPVYSLEPHEVWGARFANDALLRLNAPKDLRKDVVTLIERHMLPIWDNIKPFKVRKWRAELGDSLLHDLITHRTCDVLGKAGGDTHEEQLEVLAWIAGEQERARIARVPCNVNELAISGGELAALGLRGRAIGEVQRELLHEVLANPKLNTNGRLLDRAGHVRKDRD